MPIKLNTASGGGVTLSAANTATDKTITVPADDGTMIYANSSGNVGIGTSSPSTLIELSGSAAAGKDPSITLANTTASTGRTYSIISGDGGPLRFQDVTANAERARIDSSGNLLVGTTSNPNGVLLRLNATNAVNSGRAIQTVTDTTSTVSAIFFSNPNGNVGSVTVATSSVAYNTTSDYRLKEAVQPMTGALAKVQALNPVTYKWKVDGADSQGFIAHELQAVVPECVTGEKDAVDADGNPVYQGIDTSFLVATLTAAIKEQQQMINAQQAALETLQAKVAALEAK